MPPPETELGKYHRRLKHELPNFQNALCTTTDPEIFYPEKFQKGRREAARKICSQCEDRIECLEFALREHIHSGIWGGMTGKERREILRARGVIFKGPVRYYEDEF